MFEIFTLNKSIGNDVHCVRINSGPQNKLLQFKKLSDLSEILDLRSLKHILYVHPFLVKNDNKLLLKCV